MSIPNTGLKITLREAAPGIEEDWLDDDDRYFDDVWTEDHGRNVPHASSEKRLILEVEREPCVLEIVVPDQLDGKLSEIVDHVVQACNSFNSLREALAKIDKAADDFRMLFVDDGGDEPTITLDVDVNRVCQEFEVLSEASKQARAALNGVTQPARDPIGYLYHNPDTGTEFSENHPIESGECDDAENIRAATAEALRDELLEAWREREEAEVELAKATSQRPRPILSEWDQPSTEVEKTSTAANDVLTERERQKAAEGWTLAHDDAHTNRSLALAAGAYCESAARPKFFGAVMGARAVPKLWPRSWDFKWFKPKEPRRDLVRAAALIIAEIERLDRAEVEEISTDNATDDDCEDQGLVPTDVCTRFQCQTWNDNVCVKPALVRRGAFWCCPKCGHSYGAHAKGGNK